MEIRKDYNGFAGRFCEFLHKQDDNFVIDIIPTDDTRSQICNAKDTPFSCNPICTVDGVNIIVFNPELIQKCQLSQSEEDACILHEIGHLASKGTATETDLEIECDNMAIEAGLAMEMLSTLYKMQANLGIVLQERIEAIISNMHLFRPEWTCGRFNEEKHVAIMYNLIAGVSYYFEAYSANVIGEILKAEKNEEIHILAIASTTGISLDSLGPFFILLTQCGLLTTANPTTTGIEEYRKAIFAAKKNNVSWAEKSTAEKLPMDITSAEQQYFDAVDDGKTICTCMFELTYRCSEMCIHCYNPGATRNSSEVSHRGDCKELSLDDYKRIIDDMYSHGLVKVCLSGGDPFSKEIVWELLDYLYLKGIAVDVFTNGQKLTKCVKRLADYYPRLVGVSIYSGVAKDHDAITRIPGSWEKSMQIVRELHELAVPMCLKCCIMQPNLHSYYMVADIANEFGAVPQFEINISESNEGDICAKQLRLTEEQLQVVLRDNNLALYVGKEAPNYGGQKRDRDMCSCGAGGTGFCMSPNGDLRACAAFTQTYGNLREQSVEDILTCSTALKEWRNAVVDDYVECGRYDYCDYCNLCAGLNYTEHGDFRKPAETNCYMAKCRFNLAHKLMKYDEPMTREQLIQALQGLPIEKVKLQRKYKA